MKYGTATILIVGLLSACSSVNTMSTKESKTINQKNMQTTPGKPDLTAPEVLTKVLDFLRYAKSPEDFRIETAEKVMKMNFVPYSKEEKSAWDFYAGNDFGNTGWSWWINFDLDKSGTMRLYFGDGGGNPPATPICQIDLDQFHPLLVQAGFTYTGKGRLGKPFNGYEKKYPNGYEADLQVFYQGESKEKVLHDCINEITFDIFKPGS